jgi:hypothetical protein
VAGEQQGPATVRVSPGSSTYINVSSFMMNELIVPFEKPKLVQFLDANSRASVQQDGSSIYVSTEGEEFIQLIVKDRDAPDAPGFSVTLIPVEDIPGQHIVIKPEGGLGEATSSAASLNTNDYEDMLRELMRDAARDVIPSGFTRDPAWDGQTLQIGPVVAQATDRLIGTYFTIEYFRLTNTGASTVELVEPNFRRTGVRAISFVRDVLLAPGQLGRMVWIRDR